jgi:chromosome segregation ATPase
MITLSGQRFVLVSAEEYENLKTENQYLRSRVIELEHNADMFRQKIETDRQTIEELKRENENLKRRIEVLEKQISEQNTKISEQNTRIVALEDENRVRKGKELHTIKRKL